MGLAVGLIAVTFLVFLLGVIVRFSIISPHRIRGARKRIRRPDAAGVAGVVGFSPSADLISLYRQAPFIDRTEFYLIDVRTDPPRRWFIGGFSR